MGKKLLSVFFLLFTVLLNSWNGFGQDCTGTASVTISSSETDNEICAGETVTFTAAAVHAGTNPKFQWRVNGVNQGSNGSNATFTSPSNFQNGSVVTVVMTPDCENASPVTSGGITTTVNPLPTVGAGGAISLFCQGGTTPALGGSFGGGATSAVWSDNGAGGTFTNNSGNNPDNTTYTASAAATGSITLTLTTAGGSCGTLSATKTITVSPNPTVDAGEQLSAVCQGGTTPALGGSFGGGATSAVWSDNGAGGTFTNNSGNNPNSTTYTTSASSPASITLTLTTAGGSCGTVSASKTLTVNPNPTVSAGTALSAICQGGTTPALSGSFDGGATSAVWSDGGAGGTFSNNSGSNPGSTTYTASSTATGTINLTLTSVGGSCGTVSASKTLTVNPNPTVNAGTALSAICQRGTTAPLGGSFGGGATSAVWSDGGAGGSFTNNSGSNPESTTYTASASAPASITLTLTTAGGSCGTVSATKTLTVNPNPTVNAGTALSAICQGGTTAPLGGSFGGGAISAVWSDGGAGGSFTNNSGSNPGSTTYTASASAPASVTLTLTTSGGSCGTVSATKTLNVTPTVAPTVSITSTSTTICTTNGAPVTFTATPVNGGSSPTYQWKRNGTNIGGATNLTYSPNSLAAGSKITVEMTSNAVCPAPAKVTSNEIVMTSFTGSPSNWTGNAITSSTNSVCPPGTMTLSVPAVDNAEYYKWTLPQGFVITSGENSRSITVEITTGTTIGRKDITVQAFNPCGNNNSKSTTVNVDNFTGVTVPSPTASVCDGNSITVVGTLTGNAASGTWSSPSGTFSNIVTSNTNPATVTATYTPTITSGNVDLTITTNAPTGNGCSNSPGTAIITLKVNKKSVAPTSIVASNLTLCKGDETTLTQTGGTLGTDAVWKWYSDANYTTPVEGTVEADGSLTISPTETTTYFIRAENNAGPCDTTVNGPEAGVTVTVNESSVAPTALTASVSEICNGANTAVTLSQTDGILGTDAVWKWYTDSNYSTAYTGTVAADGSITVTPTETTTYYLRAEGNAGPCDTTVNGPDAGLTVTVNEPTIAPTALNASISEICNGANTAVTLSQTDGVLGTDAVWKWYTDSNYSTAYTGTVAADGSITVSPTETTTYYLRAEGNPGPCDTTVNGPSAGVTVTVNKPTVAPTALNASISEICNGANTAVTLSQTDGVLGTDAVWKWYTDSNYSTAYTGTVAADGSITVSPTETITYYLRAEGNAGPCDTTVNGPAAGVTVTVNKPTVAPTFLNASISEVCNGANTAVTLSQTDGVLGTDAVWKWYTDSNYSTAYTGTVAADGSITVSPTETTTYYLRAEGNAGPCDTTVNGPNTGVTITVNEPVEIVQNLDPTPIYLCAGFPLEFSIEATGTDLVYAWTRNGDPIGENSPTFEISQVTESHEGRYKVTITGACGEVASQTVDVTVNQSITFNQQPASTITSCEGDSNSITISVTADGTISEYLWRKNGIPLSNEGNISGVDTSVLTIVNQSPEDSGNYDVVISSPSESCSQIISNPSSVTVNHAPAIASIGDAIEVCSVGEEINITNGVEVINQSSIEWSVPEGKGTISNPTSLTDATYSPGNATGTVELTLIVQGLNGCSEVSSTKNIIIISQPEITGFSYTENQADIATEFCETDEGVKIPTISGENLSAGEGAYSVNPTTGLTVDAVTGNFTPIGSTPGEYTITYTFTATSNGACQSAVRDFKVVIGENPVATFSYDQEFYCKDTRDNTLNVNPAIIMGEGASAGVFTYVGPGTLALNANSGAIDLSSSDPGEYTITNTYDLTGEAEDGCTAVTAESTITITNKPIADFSYPSAEYCSDPSSPLTIEPTMGANAVKGSWTYTATPESANLVLDPTTGGIDITASAEGIYVITNTVDTAEDGCNPESAEFTITVDKLPKALFSYAGVSIDNSFCISSLGAHLEISPDTGGSYSITGPSTLVKVDASTGNLTWTIAEGVAGTYMVTYTIPAGTVCEEVSHSESIIIDALPVGGDLNFTDVGRVFTTCENAAPGYAAPLVLSGETGQVVEWQYKTATSTTWSTYNSQNKQLSSEEVETLVNNSSTIIRAKIVNGTCDTGTYSATAIVTVIPSDIKPSPVKAEPTIVCFGTDITLSSKTGYGESFGHFEGGDFTSAGIKNNGWNFTDPNGNEVPFDASANSGTPAHWHKTQPKWKFETAAINDPYTLTDMWWNPLDDGKQNEHFAITQGNFDSNMDTPPFTLTGMDEAKVTFDQAFNLTTGATIRVVLLKNGTELKELYKITGPASSENYHRFGNGTPNVNQMSLDLGSYVGETGLKIRFEYRGVRRGDVWAVDNIKVPEGPQGVLLQWFYDDNPNDTDVEQIGVDNQEVVSFTPRKIGWNDFEVKTALLLDSNGNACESLDNFERVRVFVFDTYETTVAVSTGACGSYSATLNASIKGALQGVLDAAAVTLDGYKGRWNIEGPDTNYTLTRQDEASGLEPIDDPNVIFTSNNGAEYTISWQLIPTAVYPEDYAVEELRGTIVQNPACPPVSVPVTPEFLDCSTLDFDGEDDVIVINNSFTGAKAFEAWIRPERAGGTIISGPSLEITTPTTVSPNERWYHLAVIYDDGNADLNTEGLYIDGIRAGDAPSGNGGGTRTSIGAKWTSADTEATNHFSGWIEEVRIWKNSPTLKEIRFMMNQRLKLDASGTVVTPIEGEVVPNKPVAGSYYTANGYNLDEDGDAFYNQTADDLFAYYRLISEQPDPVLKYIKFDDTGYIQLNPNLKPSEGNTPDHSVNNLDGRLHNMTTHQENTSPTPYFSNTGVDGLWYASSTWARGDLWSVPASNGTNWNIVKTRMNISSGGENIAVLGLISESNLITILGTIPADHRSGGTGNELRVTHYLHLDGNIDLNGESQLLQNHGSILLESSKGYVERDQQGKRNSFVYNYWSSPVSLTGSESNNAPYTVKEVLMDGTDPANPAIINFEPEHWAADGGRTKPITISTYWLWGFSPAEANVYAEWDHIKETGTLKTGEGFTMKGTDGTVDGVESSQNYTFRGKPHNGDITLIETTPENSFGSYENYLIGNPFPSAIDSREFILDNLKDVVAPNPDSRKGKNSHNVFDGSLYFWDHIAELNHILKDYVGGYAVRNLLEAVPAVSADLRINPNQDKSGKLPGRFIPVGQAFLINSTEPDGSITISGGEIYFKNSQRVFKKDAEDGTLFLKPEIVTKESKDKSEDVPKIRLSFNSPVGYYRQILVGAVPHTTNGFDLGYDAPLMDDNIEDMYWIQSNNQLVIQGVPHFNREQVLPLGIKVEEEKEFTIQIDTVENPTNDLKIYLKDKLTDTIHDIRKKAYVSTSEPGYIDDRFEIVFFKEEPKIEPKPEVPGEEIDYGIELSFRHAHVGREIQILNPNEVPINDLLLFDMNGKLITTYKNISHEKEVRLPVRNYSAGVYIAKLYSENTIISKKIIIQN